MRTNSPWTPDIWSEFSPTAYRRIGHASLILGGAMIGYGLAEVVSGYFSPIFFISGAITLSCAPTAFRKGHV